MSNSTNTRVAIVGTVFYAAVHKVDKFGKFSLNLVPESETESNKLVALGLQPKANLNATMLGELSRTGLTGRKLFKAEKGTIIKTGQHAGTKLPPIKVLDNKGNPMTNLIGNGSKVKVTGTISTYKGMNGMVTKFYFDEVQVLDLVT